MSSSDHLAKLVGLAEAHAFEGLSQAARHSAERIEAVAKAIERVKDYEKWRDAGFGWLVTGSLGRLEALGASDIDLVMLVPSGRTVTAAEAAFDQAVRAAVREDVHPEVSKGEDLTSPTAAAEIADPTKIGGDNDSASLLTKRILLLTESRAVLNAGLRDSIRNALYAGYFASMRSKGKHMLSLVNDVARYYRTVCVDYKHKVDKPGDWALRNMKLRHSRKFWFFASMLAMISAAVKFDGSASPDSEEAQLKAYFDMSPVERLVKALEHAGLVPHQLAIFRLYDHYLRTVGDSEVRKRLKEVVFEDRYNSPDFRGLKENSDQLHRAMLEVIADLPPNWTRHLLGRFLL